VLSDKGQVQVVVSGGICKRTTGEGTDVVRRLLLFLWSCHSVAGAHPVFPKKAGFSTVFGTVTMLQPNIISGWSTLMTQGEDPNGPPHSLTPPTPLHRGACEAPSSTSRTSVRDLVPLHRRPHRAIILWGRSSRARPRPINRIVRHDSR
jgi:hypothetical protein